MSPPGETPVSLVCVGRGEHGYVLLQEGTLRVALSPRIVEQSSVGLERS